MGKPLRTLIVEDSEDDALLIVHALRKGGFDPVYRRVETAETMRSALTEEQWDLILCDYQLPSFNGHEAITLLKKMGIGIPLILVTGAIGEEAAAECMRLGALDYIMKGNLSRLASAIERELDKATARQQYWQAEQALHENELRYRELIENMGSCVCVYEAVEDGADFIIRDFNRAAEWTERVSRRDIIGTSVLKTFPGVRDMGLLTVLERVWRTGSAEQLSAAVYKDARIEGWRENYVYKLPTGEIVAIYEDVTKRKKMEEMLRRSEQYLAKIIDFLPDSTLVVDGEGRIVAWNRAMEVMSGVKAEAMLGKGDHEYALPFYGERRPILIDMVLHPDPETEKKYTTIKWRDGTLFGESFAPHLPDGGAYLSSAASALRDEDGGIIAAIECCRDDTERQRLYDEVKRYSDEISDLYNNAPCGYHSLAPDGTFLIINDTELRWLGYGRDEIVGKIKWSDLLTEEGKEIFALSFSTLKQQGWVSDVEVDLIRKDGSLFPVLLNATGVCNEAGKYLFSRSTIFDNTERKKSKLALSAAEMLYRTISDHSQSGIYIAQEGKIRFVNPYLLKCYGYAEGELLGRVMLDFVHPADRETARQNAIRMLKGQSATPYEYRLIGANGQIRWIVETVASITYQGKTAVLGSIMDVTERRQMEKQLTDTREMLIQSEKLSAIGTLAAGVSHEILNPLNIISMNIQSMGLAEWPPEKIKQMLAVCQQQVDRIERISRDMNQFARVSTKDTGMESLNAVMERVFNLIAPKLRAADVTVDMLLQPGLPKIPLDQSKVGQVIMNLANNALDAMEGKAKKTLRVATSLKASPDGDFVRAVFSDTGTGIGRANLKNLFNPFFTTKEPGKGTGLGLAISYGIIREHGGRIWAENNELGGASFFVELPVDPKQKPVPGEGWQWERRRESDRAGLLRNGSAPDAPGGR